MTCFAQTASEVPAQPAAASQTATPDVAKELNEMKKRMSSNLSLNWLPRIRQR